MSYRFLRRYKCTVASGSSESQSRGTHYAGLQVLTAVNTNGYIAEDSNLQVHTSYKYCSTLLNIPHTNILITVF
jgi:hypothetical protein